MTKEDDEKRSALRNTAALLVDQGAMCAFFFAAWRNEQGHVVVDAGCAAEKNEMFKTLAGTLRKYADDLDRGAFDVAVLRKPVGDA